MKEEKFKKVVEHDNVYGVRSIWIFFLVGIMLCTFNVIFNKRVSFAGAFFIGFGMCALVEYSISRKVYSVKVK